MFLIPGKLYYIDLSILFFKHGNTLKMTMYLGQEPRSEFHMARRHMFMAVENLKVWYLYGSESGVYHAI